MLFFTLFSNFAILQLFLNVTGVLAVFVCTRQCNSHVCPVVERPADAVASLLSTAC